MPSPGASDRAPCRAIADCRRDRHARLSRQEQLSQALRLLGPPQFPIAPGETHKAGRVVGGFGKSLLQGGHPVFKPPHLQQGGPQPTAHLPNDRVQRIDPDRAGEMVDGQIIVAQIRLVN